MTLTKHYKKKKEKKKAAIGNKESVLHEYNQLRKDLIRRSTTASIVGVSTYLATGNWNISSTVGDKHFKLAQASGLCAITDSCTSIATHRRVKQTFHPVKAQRVWGKPPKTRIINDRYQRVCEELDSHTK